MKREVYVIPFNNIIKKISDETNAEAIDGYTPHGNQTTTKPNLTLRHGMNPSHKRTTCLLHPVTLLCTLFNVLCEMRFDISQGRVDMKTKY
jgi:hypothetical protein